jgi:hypothetical protein
MAASSLNSLKHADFCTSPPDLYKVTGKQNGSGRKCMKKEIELKEKKIK